MPPSNFFGSLGNTNFLRTHGTSPRSSLNLADETRFPGGPSAWPTSVETAAPLSAEKVGATIGHDGSPLCACRQLRGKGDGDRPAASI